MKVCLLCGESYGDAIDFCFRDGEVLASADARPTPSMQQRALATTATPSLSASGGAAGDEPDVARSNRRALMRAAAATYLAPGQSPTPTPKALAPREADHEPTAGRASRLGADHASSAGRASRLGAEPFPQTPVPVAPLDEGMRELGWGDDPEGVFPDDDQFDGFDEPFEGPPSRTGAIVAAVIGALVVVAVALGVGLLVVVGLGRNPAGSASATTTAMVEPTTRPPDPVREVVHEEPEVWTAPIPQPLRGGRMPPPAPVWGTTAEDPAPAPTPAAAEFLVSLDVGGGTEGALLLYVDGVPHGVLPARVLLGPGDHTFRVMNGHSGSEMLQVTRTVDLTSGSPGEIRALDLSR